MGTETDQHYSRQSSIPHEKGHDVDLSPEFINRVRPAGALLSQVGKDSDSTQGQEQFCSFLPFSRLTGPLR
jgi:hypothetical protein